MNKHRLKLHLLLPLMAVLLLAATQGPRVDRKWLDETRSRWFSTYSHLGSASSLYKNGISELVIVPSANMVASANEVTLKEAGRKVVEEQPLRDGPLLYIPVSQGRTYSLHMGGRQSPLFPSEVGEFTVKEERTRIMPLRVDFSLFIKDGTVYKYVALSPLFSAQVSGPSSHTISSLAQPPSRIPISLSIEDLKTKRDWESGKIRSGNTNEIVKEERGYKGTLTLREASRFETETLDAGSLNPEVRRIWRAIANAEDSEGKVLAHEMLATYFQSTGESEKAEISKRRAEFWKSHPD